MIRAAIFDLDGVVLDSMSIWRDLGARYLLRRGLTPEPGLGELLFSMSMEQGADYLRTHYPLPPEEDVLAGLSAMRSYGYRCDFRNGKWYVYCIGSLWMFNEGYTQNLCVSSNYGFKWCGGYCYVSKVKGRVIMNNLKY